MKYSDPPSNLRSLRDRLFNIANSQNVVVGRLQQHVAVLVVTQLFQLLPNLDFRHL